MEGKTRIARHKTLIEHLEELGATATLPLAKELLDEMVASQNLLELEFAHEKARARERDRQAANRSSRPIRGMLARTPAELREKALDLRQRAAKGRNRRLREALLLVADEFEREAGWLEAALGRS